MVKLALPCSTAPANLFRGVTDHEGIGWHWFRDNCSSSNHTVPAKIVAIYHSGVGSNSGWYREYTIFQLDSFMDADVVLDLAIVTHSHVFSNHDILADYAVMANSRALHHMSDMPDTRSRTDKRELA